MKVMRIGFVSLVMMGLLGCGFLNSQLERDANGESKLEQEVRAAQPVLGPYGALATAGATLITAIYGAFHSKSASSGVKSIKEPDAPAASVEEKKAA